MRFLLAFLLGFALVFALTPAKPLTITNDHGGELGPYADRIAAIRARGERVRVMGVCNSACTLVLSLPHVCAGPNARFGFHRAYQVRSPTDLTYVGESYEGTAYLLAHYPRRVRAWIASHGGLTRNIKVATGAELGVPPCQ